jgi:hypothetical protein
MNGTDAGPVPAEPAVPSDRLDDTPAAAPSLVTLVTNPRAFFEALENRPASLRVPALIVFVLGVIVAITGYQLSAVVVQALDVPGMEGLGGVMGAIGAISALIVTLLFWVIYTAIFYTISMAFNGRGDFNRLLAYVGYGHLPQIIGGIISAVLTWSYLSNLRVPSLSDPQAIAEWTQSLMQDPTMRLSAAVGILFLLWSANLWIFGVRTGRKLSTRDAAITVGVPVLLSVLYTAYTLVA